MTHEQRNKERKVIDSASKLGEVRVHDEMKEEDRGWFVAGSKY